MVPPVAEDSSMAEMWSIGPLCRYAQDLPTILKCILAEPSRADSTLRLSEPVDLSQLRLFYMCEFEDVPLCEPVQPEVKQAISRVAKFFGQAYGIHAHKVCLPLASEVSAMWLAWAERDERQSSYSLVKVSRREGTTCDAA
jgi:Asp-tRNA(Asn)/Glu-tRNA(Gln) amidotransferase A subunit family amidase